MASEQKNIFKQLLLIILCVQLVFVLSGFVANVSPSDCCHLKKIVHKVHSCCEEMDKENSSMQCLSAESVPLNSSLTNCGCIHTNPGKYSDYTTQDNFELPKTNIQATVFFVHELKSPFTKIQFNNKLEKDHSPPLFIIDSSLLI